MASSQRRYIISSILHSLPTEMTVYSYIRRRVFLRSLPFVKRVVIPLSAIFLIFHVILNSNPKINLENEEIVPGETLDPILRKPQQPHVNRKAREAVKPATQPAQDKHLNEQLKRETQLDDDLIQQNQVISPPPIPLEKTKKQTESPHVREEDKAKPQTLNEDSDVPPRIQTEWSMAKANIPDAHKVKFRGHAITNDTVTLTLMSSADKVFMSLNKREIYRAIENRGMHVVVLNQFSGRVMAKRVFDTFQDGVEEDMVDFLDDITDGRIIVFAVLDEVATGLTWKGRNKLKELGCRFSEKIAYRDMWAMATRKGELKIAETFSNVATADTGYEWGGPIFMRTDFDLEEHPVECKWPYNERNQARRQFCLRYEGYGAMCRCDVDQWSDVFFKVNKNLHKELSANPLYNQLAVVILATNRPHYLYRTLKTLHEAPGLNKDLLAIYTEKATREVTALAKLFGVTIVESGTFSNETTARTIRHKVQRVFRDIIGATFDSAQVPANSLPDDVIPPFTASNILILEEDIEVAIDIFKYFHAVYEVLDQDPTAVAISAFNYNGFREVSSSQTKFYRTNDAYGLALMMPARTVKDVLAANWPSLKSNDEWWSGLYNAMEKNKADIIFPEVSRAKHSSFEGTIVRGPVQKDWFKDHVLSMSTEYEISKEDVMSLLKEKYKNAVEEAIKNSKKIVFDFCKHELIYGKEPNVMFVKYDGKDDTHLRYVFKCLKTWAIYASSGWRDVWQFHYHGHFLTIVGVPSSPFSKLKSREDAPVTAPPEALGTNKTVAASSNSA